MDLDDESFDSRVDILTAPGASYLLNFILLFYLFSHIVF